MIISMKPNTRVAIAVIAAAIALELSMAGCPSRKGASASDAPASNVSASPTRGKIVYLEGEVKIDGSAAEIGQQLGAKARIETGPNASCEIVFDEKNALRVSQNAVASLDFSGIVKEVSLKKGGLSSVLRKLGQVAGQDSFRVVSDTAVAAVRGTCFCVWVDEKSTYVCACNGSVRTIDAKGSNELMISAAHHDARNYVKDGSAIHIAVAGIEHHSDASMESLAARIGEKIDWTKKD
jgi:ferric-dicitrate binding protein FerR (iron transport regulator)